MRNISFRRRLCKVGFLEVPIQNNLALTPAEMWRLQEQGLPISAENSGLSFDDGEFSKSWDVPFEHRRGVDLASAFEYESQVRHGLNKVIDKISPAKPAESN